MDPSDDINLSLRQIRANLGKPIYEELLEIQEFKKTQITSGNEFFENLKGLFLTGSRKGNQVLLRKRKRRIIYQNRHHAVRRRHIHHRHPDNRTKENYVAVSYTCAPEKGSDGTEGDEDGTCGEFTVENARTGKRADVEVRDGVMRRTTKFLRSVDDCELFWIDKEGVNQDLTTRKGKRENEEGVQAMDLVYKYCKVSVAILNRRISSVQQLELLSALMSGELVNENEEKNTPFSLTIEGAEKGTEVLKLVDWLTSTCWWERAWTFQEDYKAGLKMKLLISHSMNLKSQKWKRERSFGEVPGELCVPSIKFREEATKFCLALRRSLKNNDPQLGMCQRIIITAGKYTVLSQEVDDNGDETSKVMSWRIFEDVGSREITRHWDRLDIAANCCNYTSRLHRAPLEDKKKSLSLAVLATFLLNGEIMLNAKKSRKDEDETLDKNIFSFLKAQSIEALQSPVCQELTFFKGCRFINASLTKDGIRTEGHLWVLGKTFSFKPSSAKIRSLLRDNHHVIDHEIEIECLKQLVLRLRSKALGKSYLSIAQEIEDHYHDVRRSTPFAKRYMRMMVSSLVSAMFDPEKEFVLACPFKERKEESSPYHGIFVCEKGKDLRNEVVFTAARKSSEDLRDLDKYVNLRVGSAEDVRAGKPLVVGSWVNGLCFLQRKGLKNVTFRWPEVLIS